MDNKKKILIILVIVLSIIVVGLGSFIVYDNNVNNDVNYEDYAASLKGEIKKYTDDFYNIVTINSECVADEYLVKLNKNNELYVSINDSGFNKQYNNYKLANNVLSFFVVESGQGGCNNLYFIKEDGTVSSANIEYALLNNGGNGEILVNDSIKNLKDIVYITSGIENANADGNRLPIFVDIKGNIYK